MALNVFVELGYIGLFIAALLAATVLPLSSEVVLGALLVSGWSPVTLVLVATAGNVLGSLINYGLGYWASLSLIKKWLRLTDAEFTRAERRFKRWGTAALCFAWVPVVGDPLTVLAGILRIRLLWFVLLVTLGKGLRYVVLSYVTLQFV